MEQTQKSLFIEKEADKQIIKSLLRTIKQLKGEFMSKVIKSTDGKYYLVHDYEEVTSVQVQAELAVLQKELQELEAISPEASASSDQNNEQTAPATDQTQTTDTSSDQTTDQSTQASQPETPAAPAESDQGQVTDPNPPAPTDQGATDQTTTDQSTPANDPNAITLQ